LRFCKKKQACGCVAGLLILISVALMHHSRHENKKKDEYGEKAHDEMKREAQE
jgi:hypothetical protein